MNPAFASIFALAHRAFEDSTISIAISDGEKRQSVKGVRASVLRGNAEAGVVGASQNAEQWGVSFRLAEVATALTLPLLDWRDGTICVTDRTDVPVLTIQRIEENRTGVAHCTCSARGRGAGRS